MKHDPAVKLLNSFLSDLAGMNNIGVLDKVNYLVVHIVPIELLEQFNKQCTAFAITFHPDHTPSLNIPRSSKRGFNILAWSQHRLLLSRQHVVGAYLRIQVYVNFVLVQWYYFRAILFSYPLF